MVSLLCREEKGADRDLAGQSCSRLTRGQGRAFGINNGHACLMLVNHEVDFQAPGETLLAREPIELHSDTDLSIEVTVQGDSLKAKVGTPFSSLLCQCVQDHVDPDFEGIVSDIASALQRVLTLHRAAEIIR
jgi:hypothetical protein